MAHLHARWETPGKMENYEMAKRFKAVYPNLFEGKYNSDVIFLRATQEQRCVPARSKAHQTSIRIRCSN